MPTVREIEAALFTMAPKAGAMEWDNVGHLVGDPEAQVSRVLVSLDITQAVAEEAIAAGCQLIVSHHPVMNCNWNPVQTLRPDDPQGYLLLTLLQNHVAAVCMHTNLDVAQGGVNDALAQALRLEDPGPLSGDGIGRVGTLPAPMPLAEFAAFICRALGANGVRFVDGGRPVCKVAVGGGACGNMGPTAIACGCDTFVTSDVKYHEFQEAEALGLNLIDAGHYPTENVVCPVLANWLQESVPDVCVLLSQRHHEVFSYC